MSDVYLGIDVGGTKTHALLADTAGRVLGVGACGPGNHEQVGYDGLAAALATTTDEALRQAGLTRDHISGAGFGLCGYDWPSERAPHEAAIRTLGLRARWALVNDAVLGLVAGADDGWGVCVVAGTGCNCWGRDASGRLGHVIGMGEMVGEAGGGGEIVREALRRVAHASTLYGPPTSLGDAFARALALPDAAALLEAYCEGHVTPGAAYAQLVFAEAHAGDPVALDVMTWAGRELGALAVAVVRQLSLGAGTFDLVTAGSIPAAHPAILPALVARVHAEAPGARPVSLLAPPVVGAVLLGMDAAQLAGTVKRAARPALCAFRWPVSVVA